MLEKIKDYFVKNERILAPVTLIAGFIFDYLTIRRVDFFWDNFFVILYLFLAGISVLLINFYHQEGSYLWLDRVHEFLPFFAQFAFGGLFSAFLIFYSKSASLFTSGIFILILFGLFIGNEFFKERYAKLAFQIAIYFIATFSFFIYFLPVIFRKIGTPIFLVSGIASILFIALFIFIISRLTPTRYEEDSRRLIYIVLGLYLFINILYFTNIIPPIPLSLREADVYHSIVHAGNNYKVSGESNTWREKFDLPQSVHVAKGAPLYFFSSVFAPSDLDTTIVHDWQYYDEDENDWISEAQIDFTIVGGRNEGYRGFSKKEIIRPGKWRVDVTTERGQVIGRARFNVLEVNTTPSLESKTI